MGGNKHHSAKDQSAYTIAKALVERVWSPGPKFKLKLLAEVVSSDGHEESEQNCLPSPDQWVGGTF